MFLVIISALSLVSCCETLYVVIRAGPISCHAVRMLSLCVYYDLYALMATGVMKSDGLLNRFIFLWFSDTQLQIFGLNNKFLLKLYLHSFGS